MSDRARAYWWGRYDEPKPARRDRRWRALRRRRRRTAPRIPLLARIARGIGSLVAGVS